jgi:ribosomal protein S17
MCGNPLCNGGRWWFIGRISSKAKEKTVFVVDPRRVVHPLDDFAFRSHVSGTPK